LRFKLGKIKDLDIDEGGSVIGGAIIFMIVFNLFAFLGGLRWTLYEVGVTLAPPMTQSYWFRIPNLIFAFYLALGLLALAMQVSAGRVLFFLGAGLFIAARGVAMYHATAPGHALH
jgi:hypothetical protein